MNLKIFLSWTISIICLKVIEASLESDKQTQSEGIKVLEFSPGGVDFYERHLRQHEPVIIKGAVSHWPALKHWTNTSYLIERLSTDDNPLHYGSTPVVELLKEGRESNISISKQSNLSKDVYLPFLIQCEEYLKNVSSVNLITNRRAQNHVLLSDKEQFVFPLFHPLSVLLFGVSPSLMEENSSDVNTFNEDVEKYLFLKDLRYQKVQVNPGDLLFIPKFSWFILQSSNDVIDYISFKFDVFAFNLDATFEPLQALKKYEDQLKETPPTIACKNNNISIQEVLKIDINNLENYMHLRIPKINERPQDIILASGYRMPVLGFGTALLNETTYDAVKTALEVGYRLFDLAYGYPFSEVSFAKALTESSVSRENVFVVTKLHPRYLGYNETLRAIDWSLQNLNTSYIDLYLIHSMECDDFLLRCEEGEPHGTWKDSWRAMEKAKQDGKIRSLGFSNIYGSNILELVDFAKEPVSVIQNWFDPLNQDSDTREFCRENNIRYMGYSTLGTRWKMMGLDYNPIMESDIITSIAGHYDYVISHVVLRWAIHVNVTVIPRSSNPKHIRQNFRSLDISMFPADIEEMNSLEQVMQDMVELEQPFFGEEDVSE